MRHKKPRRVIEGNLSISRRGIYVRCRLACVVKNSISRQDHLRNPPMVVFAAIGRKRLRILGRVFLLSQIPVSARHVCLNHCIRSLFQIYTIDFCFRTLLQIFASDLCFKFLATNHCFRSLLQLTASAHCFKQVSGTSCLRYR